MIGGRYSLDREIGRGGMGAVWLGRDELLGRPVAVKRLGSTLASGSADFERAEREARIAAHLNHPNVVAVFDLVTEGDIVWLVMEYVAGATLAEVIRRNERLGVSDTAAVLSQIAEALTAAHAAGIVHRDVKPSNVLVGDDGSVKLSDFGIARTESDTHLTQTGLVTGSPAYLAPEVASGEQATFASDVWSLGATAFHAVTGRPPYDVGDNLMGALYRIVHEPTPQPEGAGWLTPLIESTMVHDPGRRWRISEVVGFLSGSPGGASSHPLHLAHGSDDPHVDSAPSSVTGTEVRGYATSTTQHRPPPRSSGPFRVLPLLVVAAMVALVVMVGLLVTQTNDLVDDPSGADSPTPSAETSPKTDPSPTEDPGPTEEGIKQFVGDYLTTASSDPDRGFTMLTPAFQAASTPGYTQFWSSVSNPEIISISADPEARTVTYRYRYTVAGQGRRTERVDLRLVYKKGTYLIDGES